jgi:uncharacterized protein (TIGR03086 family)
MERTPEVIADRYRRVSGLFTDVVDAVPTDAWDAPTPCEGWGARQVVEHVVDSEGGFLARFDLAPAAEGDDPVSRWPTVRDSVQAALDDHDKATITYDGMFGPTTLAETVDQFLCADLVVHSWDIARAAGLRDFEELPADEVELIHSRLAPLGDAIRSPGVFGPEVPVPEDASAQDRLLGFIGRQP